MWRWRVPVRGEGGPWECLESYISAVQNAQHTSSASSVRVGIIVSLMSPGGVTCFSEL